MKKIILTFITLLLLIVFNLNILSQSNNNNNNSYNRIIKCYHYPNNPVKEYTIITFDLLNDNYCNNELSTIYLDIYSLVGINLKHKIYYLKLNQESNKIYFNDIDSSLLTNGIYLYKITTHNQSIVNKMVINR